MLLPSVVLLDFLYGLDFLKKVPPGLLSKSFLFPIFLPYFLYKYLLLGRPILKLIRPLSKDEQIPTHRVRANSLFLQVNRGKITDSYQSSVGKQVQIPRRTFNSERLKNDRVWMAEHMQFKSLWIVTDS